MASETSASRTRILHLVDSLGVGGTEKQLFLTIKMLGQEAFEHHVFVFNSSYDDLQTKLIECGARIWHLSPNARNYFSRCLEISRVIKKVKPDVIHSWTYHHNLYVGVIGMISGARHRIGSVRNDYFKSIQVVSKTSQRIISLTIDAFVINSSIAYHQMKEEGIQEKKLHLIRNFVEVGEDAAGAAKLAGMEHLSDHSFTLGTIGNLRNQKNHLMFVEVIGKLSERYDVQGVLAGQVLNEDPSVLENIEGKVMEHGLEEKFFYVGFQPDIPALLELFDVFCLTSKYEGLPNVVLEAMVVGKQVVATKVGALPDLVVDGENGFLVDPGDADAFVGAVEKIIMDPVLRERMGEASKRILTANFDPEATAKKFRDLYQQEI